MNIKEKIILILTFIGVFLISIFLGLDGSFSIMIAVFSCILIGFIMLSLTMKKLENQQRRKNETNN